ncbi:MAG: thiamine diphosphokinase [Clostridia bacterium]|nr:thiamine diphosphokinase [Clostridia bacterium]
MRKICYIVGASDTQGIYIDKKEEDYVIAADAGFAALQKLGIVPDMVVGDMDSLGDIPNFENLVRHPVEKDDTDTALALAEGIKLGYRDFIIYGGLGRRLDHSIANLQNCVGMADHGARCWLWGEGNAVCVFADGEISFEKDMAGTISVFTFSRAYGVTLDGLKYPLTDACLTSSVPLGVSNEFMGVPAKVSVTDGTLTVMWSEGAANFARRARQ